MNDNELFFSLFLIAGILIFLKMISSVITTSIRSFHDSRQYWGKNQHGVPPMFQKMTDKAMAERDEEIADLRERIEVLEKIVTDQHNQSKARALADEIDKLKS